MVSLSVIVPFYNEENLLENSVNRLLENNIYNQIILIDNNSTDNSYKIAEKISNQNENIILDKTSEEKGKGVGVLHSRQHITSSHAVIHDADLEYFPSDIIEMFEIAKKNPESFVIGSRVIGDKKRSNVYLRAKLANGFLSKLFSIVHGSKITDITTCYKLMPCDFFLKNSFNEQGFSIDLELISKFIKKSKNIIEVPIMYEGRSYKEGKKIKTIDFFRYIKNIFKFKFRSS
tara:strand:- start:18158 stop:18853 length:696 start_codon:yes stop_codon:yes gene_type:complete